MLVANLVRRPRIASHAGRLAVALALVVFSAVGIFTQSGVNAQAPGMPPAQKPAEAKAAMRFELVREGPDEACGNNCREWVSASGPIAPGTGRDFEAFAQKHNLQGRVIVMESGGGNVAGGLVLGRAIRRLNMTVVLGSTTLLKLPPTASGQLRGSLSSKVGCASMCTYSMLGGVRRHVPVEARVSVHQIWPGDMRADATASDYTAESLVRLLRINAEVARYTVEMGGDIELFEIANRIPPWEPLRVLTRAEIVRFRMHNTDAPFAPATATEKPPGMPAPSSVPPSGPTTSRWALVGGGSERGVARSHPLTVEGNTIGSFVFTFGCGFTAEMLSMQYAETRRLPSSAKTDAVQSVLVFIGGERVELKVESSRPSGGRLESVARGIIALGLVSKVTEGDRSFNIATQAESKVRTVIRIGNTGLAAALPQLTMACQVSARR